MRKILKKQSQSKAVHKDPVRYPVIEKYESEFKKNFTFTTKLSIVEITKKIKSWNK